MLLFVYVASERALNCLNQDSALYKFGGKKAVHVIYMTRYHEIRPNSNLSLLRYIGMVSK